MIKFNTYPNYSLKQLEEMNISKGELMKKMFGEQRNIDTALPQTWLDTFCAENNLEYDLVRSTTFFVYDDSFRGYPVSGCTEVQNVISEYLNNI